MKLEDKLLATVLGLAMLVTMSLVAVGQDFPGWPDPLRANTWAGRTTPTTMTVGSSTGSIQVLAAKKGDLNLNTGPEANAVIKLRASDAGGTMRDALSCDGVNGCTLGPGNGVTSTLFGQPAIDMVIKTPAGHTLTLSGGTNGAEFSCDDSGQSCTVNNKMVFGVGNPGVKKVNRWAITDVQHVLGAAGCADNSFPSVSGLSSGDACAAFAPSLPTNCNAACYVTGATAIVGRVCCVSAATVNAQTWTATTISF